MKRDLPMSKRHHTTSFRAGAFTLIELLVVIAIIGILAAILIPAVGRVRDSANSAKCVSHLRQIGIIFHNYLQDHDGQFPYSISTETKKSWDYNLLLYVTTEANADQLGAAGQDPHEAFSCPAAAKPARGKVSASSYAINQELVGIYTSSMESAPGRTRLINVIHPADTYLATDCDEREFRRASKSSFSTVKYDGQTAIDRHDGFLNMLYVDGSVRRIKFETMPWGSSASASEAPWGAK